MQRIRKDLTSCSLAAIFMKFLVNVARVHPAHAWVGMARPLTVIQSSEHTTQMPQGNSSCSEAAPFLQQADKNCPSQSKTLQHGYCQYQTRTNFLPCPGQCHLDPNFSTLDSVTLSAVVVIYRCMCLVG